MKSYELMETYIEARRLHDAAVGDIFAAAWARLLQCFETLGKPARVESRSPAGLRGARAA